jgi:hypothetical protein
MPANRDELISQIFTIWDELEIDVVESCIENMERRLTEVVRMRVAQQSINTNFFEEIENIVIIKMIEKILAM